MFLHTPNNMNRNWSICCSNRHCEKIWRNFNCVCYGTRVFFPPASTAPPRNKLSLERQRHTFVISSVIHTGSIHFCFRRVFSFSFFFHQLDTSNHSYHPIHALIPISSSQYSPSYQNQFDTRKLCMENISIVYMSTRPPNPKVIAFE